MAGSAHGTSDIEGLFGGTRAGPMIADVEVDQDIDSLSSFGGGLFVPLGLLNVIHYDHRTGLDDAGDLEGIGNR
jgi:hypothetical protein